MNLLLKHTLNFAFFIGGCIISADGEHLNRGFTGLRGLEIDEPNGYYNEYKRIDLTTNQDENQIRFAKTNTQNETNRRIREKRRERESDNPKKKRIRPRVSANLKDGRGKDDDKKVKNKEIGKPQKQGSGEASKNEQNDGKKRIRKKGLQEKVGEKKENIDKKSEKEKMKPKREKKEQNSRNEESKNKEKKDGKDKNKNRKTTKGEKLKSKDDDKMKENNDEIIEESDDKIIDESNDEIMEESNDEIMEENNDDNYKKETIEREEGRNDSKVVDENTNEKEEEKAIKEKTSKSVEKKENAGKGGNIIYIDKDKENKPTSSPTFLNEKIRSTQRGFIANLERFPGSLFPVDTTGQVLIRFEEGDGNYRQRVLVQLRDVEGLETNCTRCEARVYGDATCNDMNLENKSHHKQLYDTDENGYSNSQFTLPDGLNYDDGKEKIIVLYDSDGEEIACGLFRFAATNYVANMLVASMYKVRDYDGAVTTNPSGTTKALFNDKDSRFALYFNVIGLDANCADCKVGIYEGTRCDEVADFGEPFWNSDVLSNNPWTDVIYSYDTNLMNSLYMLDVGYDFFDMSHHIVLIHDKDGVPFSCGELLEKRSMEAPKYLVAEIDVHPDSTGPIVPSGKIHVQEEDNGVMVVEVDLLDLEDSCTSSSCTIAIHQGFSCNSGEIGEHYWNNKTSSVDIWENTTYSVVEGQSLSIFSVPTGFNSFFDNVGHAIVVTDSSRKAIGCGILMPSKKTKWEDSLYADIDTIHTYYGDFRPEGTVHIGFSEDHDNLIVEVNVNGLENKCEGCDINIRNGTSCHDVFELGPPHYNADVLDENPWIETNRTTTYTGYTSSGGVSTSSFQIDNGYGFKENLGHAVVIHDKLGGPIACGILKSEMSRKEGDTLIAKMQRHNVADENMTPHGEARLRFLGDDAMVLNYEILGLSKCKNCKIRLRQGRRCDQLGLDITGIDFSLSYYDTDDNCASSGSILLKSENFKYKDGWNRIVVFFDQNDDPLACGVLDIGKQVNMATKHVASMSMHTFNDKEVSPNPFGSVAIFQEKGGADMKIVLNSRGMPECSAPGCPAHVHVSTCNNPGTFAIQGTPNYLTDENSDVHEILTTLNSQKVDITGLPYLQRNKRWIPSTCGILRKVEQTESPAEFRKKVLQLTNES